MALVLGMALHAMAMVTAVMARPEHPHIVMVMGDDIGFANVGWNRAVPTPEVQVCNCMSLISLRDHPQHSLHSSGHDK